MKLLYIASNPDNQVTLDIERDITELQRRASAVTIDPVRVVFEPGLKFSELPTVLHREKPDILHIAAHGSSAGEYLYFSNESKKQVKLTPGMLRSFIHDRNPPRLVYLNSCDSAQFAKTLIDPVPMAIGSTAPIGIQNARDAALAFYERIFDGSSVERAFDVAKHVMVGTMEGKAQLTLYSIQGLDILRERLLHVPQIVAEFERKRFRAGRDGHFAIRLGIMGVPVSTHQVIFFTDDATFISDDEETQIEEDLCFVVRDSPVRGWLWADGPWHTTGDFQLHAAATTAGGQTFTISSSLCEALETRYRLLHGRIPAIVQRAIETLRLLDGSDSDG